MKLIPGKIYKAVRFKAFVNQLALFFVPNTSFKNINYDNLCLNDEFLVLEVKEEFWAKIALCHKPVVGWITLIWLSSCVEATCSD
jgi:hypothetical protein